MSRNEDVMRRLHDAALGDEGALPYPARLALATGRDIAPELAAYADKVARHAYRVTERDLDALRGRLRRRQEYWARVAPGFLEGDCRAC